MIVQTPELQAFVTSGKVGSDSLFTDGFVFDSEIPRPLDDQSDTACIVFAEDTWSPMNEYNTLRFPLLLVDIWAAPERDSTGSVIENTADDLIEEIFNAILPYFHTVDRGVPGNTGSPLVPYMGLPGMPRYWGTASEIAGKTGYPIVSSVCIAIQEPRDVVGGNGVRFRSHRFGIEAI